VKSVGGEVEGRFNSELGVMVSASVVRSHCMLCPVHKD
jgi:hypothetical protein